MQALSQVDEWIGAHGVPGVGAAVWSGGEIVAERYVGEARAGVPVTQETLFPLASVTKPVAAATFMTLVDDGVISLDEPVGRLLPEFRAGPAAGAEGVDPALERLRPTIGARQLLCHVSGLPEDLGPRESRYRGGATIETIIDQMCRLPLQSAPGDELRYSNAGYGVIARLTEQISGQPFWQTAREPRTRTAWHSRHRCRPERARTGTGRASRRHQPSRDGIESYNSAYWRGLALPWGGLFGTPRDAVRFAAAFLPSGERFLSEAATSLMTTDQTMGVPGASKARRCGGIPGAGVWAGKSKGRSGATGPGTSPRRERSAISVMRERCCGVIRNGISLWRSSQSHSDAHVGLYPSAMGAAEQCGHCGGGLTADSSPRDGSLATVRVPGSKRSLDIFDRMLR